MKAIFTALTKVAEMIQNCSFGDATKNAKQGYTQEMGR
jgi:hypothetical protein